MQKEACVCDFPKNKLIPRDVNRCTQDGRQKASEQECKVASLFSSVVVVRCTTREMASL